MELNINNKCMQEKIWGKMLHITVCALCICIVKEVYLCCACGDSFGPKIKRRKLAFSICGFSFSLRFLGCNVM